MAWAKNKSQSIKQVAAAIASGTAIAERITIKAAVAAFLEASTAQPSTIASYKPALARFEQWAAKAGVRETQDLKPPHLTAFREFAAKLTVAAPKPGAKRGKRQASTRRHSTVTVNTTLGLTKMALRWMRLRGFLPHVDSDAVRERLKPLKVDRDAPEILRPAQAKKLLEAAQRHDATTFDKTRAEHSGEGEVGTTVRYEPCAPFVLLLLLTGMRAGEAIGLRWDEVDLAAEEIRLPASRVKTRMARTITLTESPTAIDLLRALRLRVRGSRVFPVWTADLAKSTRARLLKDYKAPAKFSWQACRRTCAAIGTNAPGVFGAASAYRSAKRLGHGVQVAERSYVDLIRNLPADATTFEAAMGIEAEAKAIVESVGGIVAENGEPAATG